MKSDLSFPSITLKYLSALSRNNNREWFEKNRERFTFEFLEPATQFVVDMGEKLSSINPDLQYVPRIDKSIFRLHRDVRFSKNKSPYKSNLGILLWEGKRKKMECSGYYFHIEPGSFFLGAGLYMFAKDQLKNYRDIVSDPVKGKELNDIIKSVLKYKRISLGGRTFKRTPKGYDPEYKYADLLLHSGLYVSYESNDLSEIRNVDLVKFCFKLYKLMSPLHNWLVKNIN